MPAKTLGCKVRHVDSIHWLGQNFIDTNEGVAIWQILCNGARLNFARAQMAAGIPVYVEVDDDYTHWDAAVANADWTPEMPENNIQASVKLHRHICGLVDGIICSTEALADAYRELNDNVHVCRNSVDLDDWKSRIPKTEDEPFVILWAASASHKMDQKLILPALEWAAEQSGVEVYLVGLQLPNSGYSKIKTVPWINGQQEYRDKLVELKPDVGIAVLKDSNFTRGKSDLKVLEYGVLGALPIVSPLTPYKDWLDKIPTARNAQDWLNALQWAVSNKEEVKARAKEIHDFVITERNIKKEANAWLKAVEKPLVELEG
jgi:glycosyltransferase involved in cell wall biosynthesis